MRFCCFALSVCLVWSLACGGFSSRDPVDIRTDMFGPTLEKPPARSAPTPLDDDILVTGTRGAPITVIQYSDWQCGHCGAAYPDVLAAVQAEPMAALYFRTFPLTDECGPGSTNDRCTLAAAALCADDDGNFASFAPSTFRDPEAVLFAASSGPTSAWKTCVAAPETMERVVRHKAAGTIDGIRGTPTLIVGAANQWTEVRPGDLQAHLQSLASNGPAEPAP